MSLHSKRDVGMRVTPELQKIIEAAASAAVDAAFKRFAAGQSATAGPPQVDRLLRLEEVLKVTGLSRSAAYRLMQDKVLQPVHQGRAISFKESEVRAYIAGLSADA